MPGMNKRNTFEFVGPLQPTLRQTLIRQCIRPSQPSKAELAQLQRIIDSSDAATSAIAHFRLTSAIPGIEVTYLDDQDGG
jgi:hypothetical protein